jgi:hypothetical protein
MQFQCFFHILGIQKSDLDEVAKMMFQVGEWPWELIICPLDVLKNDFCEIDEEMFQEDELSFRTRSVCWTSKKSTWMKSHKLCFK